PADRKEDRVQENLHGDGPDGAVEGKAGFESPRRREQQIQQEMLDVVVLINEVAPARAEQPKLPQGNQHERRDVKGIEAGKAQQRKPAGSYRAARDLFGVEPVEDETGEAEEHIDRHPAPGVDGQENARQRQPGYLKCAGFRAGEEKMLPMP